MICENEAGFLAQIRPLVQRNDLAGLLRSIAENWSAAVLVRLLSSDLAEVVRLASVCLGYCGSFAHVRPLVEVLGSADDAVVAAAEDALWNIWMRAGSDASRTQLSAALDQISQEEYFKALEMIGVVCAAEPAFAEAHHQRAIALHSLGRLDDARDAYGAAVALNRYHYSAMAAMGHIATELGDFEAALEHYRDALAVHPRLADLSELMPSLHEMVTRRSVA